MTTIASIAENQKETGKTRIEIVGMKGGLITWAALIIYFIIMKSFNLLQSEIAWTMNIFVLGGGILLTYRYYRTKSKLNIDYLPGLTLGIITTAVSVILFSLFTYFWFSQIEVTLLELLKPNALFMGGELTSPSQAAASIMIEGGCSGVIISFMLMQYYKSGFRKSKGEVQEG